MKKKLLIALLLALLILIILLITLGNKKSIIGKWKSIDTENDYYYIFNEDNTCSYEMKVARLDCTYEDDGKKITIIYDGSTKNNIFEYEFKNSTLIIKDVTNKEYKFIKEK